MNRQKIHKIFVLAIISCAASAAMIAGGLCLWGNAQSDDAAQREAMAGRLVDSMHLTGSGFAVAPGYVVTNAHVTMECRAHNLPILVGGSDGWQVVHEDPSMELALLAGPAAQLPTPVRLSAGFRLERGTKVMLLGYPMNRAGGADRLVATPGSVDRAALTVHQPQAGRSVSFYLTSADGQTTEPTWQDGVAYFGAQFSDRLRWILDIAAPSVHGESGGPVVDVAGNVVGVIFAGSRDAGETSAVTLADLREFLLQSNILPSFASPPDADADFHPALDAISGSVARVSC